MDEIKAVIERMVESRVQEIMKEERESRNATLQIAIDTLKASMIEDESDESSENDLMELFSSEDSEDHLKRRYEGEEESVSPKRQFSELEMFRRAISAFSLADFKGVRTAEELARDDLLGVSVIRKAIPLNYFGVAWRQFIDNCNEVDFRIRFANDDKCIFCNTKNRVKWEVYPMGPRKYACDSCLNKLSVIKVHVHTLLFNSKDSHVSDTVLRTRLATIKQNTVMLEEILNA
jgi:hypothetical protein